MGAWLLARVSPPQSFLAPDVELKGFKMTDLISVLD